MNNLFRSNNGQNSYFGAVTTELESLLSSALNRLNAKNLLKAGGGSVFDQNILIRSSPRTLRNEKCKFLGTGEGAYWNHCERVR